MPDEVVIDLLKVLEFLVNKRKFCGKGSTEFTEGYSAALDESIKKVSDMLNSHAVSASKFAHAIDRKLAEHSAVVLEARINVS